jgi:hypothetical protein
MNTASESLLERLRRPDAQVPWVRFVELYTPLIYYWARWAGLQMADAALGRAHLDLLLAGLRPSPVPTGEIRDMTKGGES